MSQAQQLSILTDDWNNKNDLSLWLNRSNVPKEGYDTYGCVIKPPSLDLFPGDAALSKKQGALWVTQSYKAGDMICPYSGRFTNDETLAK
jgi:hypothetical protein